MLADPNSIFMCGLARFKRRTLYSNIVNDRSAVYYTTMITKTDPYTDLSEVKVNYAKGYGDVILDPANPVSPRPVAETERQALVARLRARAASLPIIVALVVFIPIAAVAFLLTSVVQTARSSQRIRLHEKGLAGINTANYRMPLLIKEIRGAVEDAYENLNSAQNHEYLGLEGGDGGKPADDEVVVEDEEDGDEVEDEADAGHPAGILALERRQSHPEQPTLALTADQFAMVRSLDRLGWRKYPVWIHNHRHSHAAIILRKDKASFAEGKVVLRHWMEEEFLL